LDRDSGRVSTAGLADAETSRGDEGAGFDGLRFKDVYEPVLYGLSSPATQECCYPRRSGARWPADDVIASDDQHQRRGVALRDDRIRRASGSGDVLAPGVCQ